MHLHTHYSCFLSLACDTDARCFPSRSSSSADDSLGSGGLATVLSGSSGGFLLQVGFTATKTCLKKPTPCPSSLYDVIRNDHRSGITLNMQDEHPVVLVSCNDKEASLELHS